eukprot:CAMPEP_0172492706 /NCGR_PEP_ID=MMETSP1066-20121228/23937_1 /TAXON_ID=671091 /ORGANISM="Coscinodiscus wailesii, Strain CCMP2513" /LENGTH=565 /DNA_ID=CAMNT_0013262487 /DNA_START=187 /DNA_END=1884 /DNA_ORIENTATION=+
MPKVINFSVFLLLVLSPGNSFQAPFGHHAASTTVSSSILQSKINGDDNNGINEKKSWHDYSIDDSYNLIVLGDLHLEDDMTSHHQARSDCISALHHLSLLPCPPTLTPASTSSSPPPFHSLLSTAQNTLGKDLSPAQLSLLRSYQTHGPLTNCHLVSLGDLGRKDIRHEPGDAGTTKSFTDAKTYFDGFSLPHYDVITGNHDLEGLDEFSTDAANLAAWQRTFQKDTPYFSRRVGHRTLLVGLSTVRFRDAPFSSHECWVDPLQLSWFEDVVRRHSAEEGWKIIVFSHAPVVGSGLRVLQNVHVVNGCAWLNHCDGGSRNRFIEIVERNPQVKLWFSGHFHLSHDYEDALCHVGKCTFLQCGVVGKASSRDGRRQTRLVQGNSHTINLYSINHHKRDDKNDEANIRLDAIVDLTTGQIDIKQGYNDYDHDQWFSAYVPKEEDGCFLGSPDCLVACQQTLPSSVCWWHMDDGAVLGLHDGQLVEYDKTTLSPLGIVVTKEQLKGREVLVVEEGTAVVLLEETTGDVEVVHPNDDGSYWRKMQRNKRVRQEEKAREAVAKLWLERKK